MIYPYPLTRSHRILLARAFRHVPRVDLSIDCLLEDQSGNAYVDDLEQPSAFLIDTVPFFYFAGSVESSAAQDMVRSLPGYCFLMPSAPGWFELAQQIHGEKLYPLKRYSFSSAQLSLDHLDAIYQSSPHRERIFPMDTAFVVPLWGQDHYVDLTSYDSVDDFLQRGVGFYARSQSGKLAGTAYADLVCSRGIEISLYVIDDYRRQGWGTALAACLVRWCLQHNLDPHWDAANPESAHLAQKLGYLPLGTYQAFSLES
jgi:GNAT superfamily N-acetyltransferase